MSVNREFGFNRNNDGSYTFYTKGVDRITDLSNDFFFEHKTFSDADNLWTSFQKGIKEYINSHGGNANINDPKKIRPDWDKILKVLDPNDSTSISDLEECQ